MPFDSKVFLLFCAVVLAVHHQQRIPWFVRRLALLGMSYGFYASWSPSYLPFLALSTVLDWDISKRIARSRAPVRRAALLAASIALNLGLLGYFKYGPFIQSWFGDAAEPGTVPFVPLGISFFTFQTMSYTVDVHRGRIRPCERLSDFALFVSFFPQLVSGPVVRAEELLPQLERPPERVQWGFGGFLILLGLFLKMVVADGLLGPIANVLYEAPSSVSLPASDHVIGIYAFFGQLYADFAGYSNLAIGLALLLGVSLPENFRSPFAATSVREFWRRWHMTLTRWFGDYVYKPLGGNRVSSRRAVLNVFVVMFLVGLWHGPAWTFVVWGLANAALLTADRAVARLGWGRHVPEVLQAGLVFALVGLTCTLFRAHDLPHAVELMLGLMPRSGTLTSVYGKLDVLWWAVALGGLFGAQWVVRDWDLARVIERVPWWARAILMSAMLISLWMLGGTRNAYLYFEF